MSDFHPCNTVTVSVGQDLLTFGLPRRCTAPPGATFLNVFRHDKTQVARYALFGADANGAVFYIDAAINARAGNYTYNIESCGVIVTEGTMVVQPSMVRYAPTPPIQQCKCEGC